MTGRNRVRYSQEQKEVIVKRMMPPNNESVAQISKEEGITEVTLYKWRKEARAAGVATPGNGQTSDKWSSQDKFLIVMETFAMNETELAEYCRIRRFTTDTNCTKACGQRNLYCVRIYILSCVA